MQVLTKEEIDRRIERLIADLASDVATPDEASAGTLHPRPLAPAELIRRMKPFLANN